MFQKVKIFGFFIFLFSRVVFAQEVVSQSLPKSILSEQKYRELGQENEILQRSFRNQRISEQRPLRPATDFDEFHYFLMSAEFSFSSREMKKTIVENLPARMKLVLLTSPGNERRVIRDYRKWIDPSRIIVATHRTAHNGFWSRDSFPYPVYLDSSLKLGLVASRYDREFSAHDEIAKAAKSSKQMRKWSHVFVGGNLLADENGRCFVVESVRLFSLRDETLINAYGCTAVHRLKHLSGIGDVDEVIKILPGKRVLTTREEYRSLLEGLGYQVFMLPQLSSYRTYANSILIDNIVIMPKFDREEDEQAQKVYESLGYRVFPVPSSEISMGGLGSVHCATMAYPKIDEEVLMRSLRLERFHF